MLREGRGERQGFAGVEARVGTEGGDGARDGRVGEGHLLVHHQQEVIELDEQ